MYSKKLLLKRLKRLEAFLLAAAFIGWAFPVQAQTAAATLPAPAAEQANIASLKEAFDAAWSRQPEALALQARREAAQARTASYWTPEPPAIELTHKSDRFQRNEGSRELEVGIAVPLWLPGERRGSASLAKAESAIVETRAEAARLRVAASVREAWWNWQRTRIDVEIAHGQLDSAHRLASDVARRTKVGELARADRHQADGAVATAEAALAQAEAAATASLQQLKALSGGLPPAIDASIHAEPEPLSHPLPPHPALAELQDRATVAERAAALAAIQSRANPELILAATRDRGAFGDQYDQSITFGVRIPFSAGSRHDSRVAAARAEAIEAEAQLALDRAQLQSENEAALARVDAGRKQLQAAERRTMLARQAREFFDKSFRLGETDLPTRLRIDSEAFEAERQAARSRVELAAAISAWRQALGLLPQ